MNKIFVQKLRIAASEADDLLTSCDASDLLDGLEVARDFMFEAADEIEQLESRLAQAERERDAAVNDCGKFLCNTCRYNGYAGVCYICHNVPGGGRANYEWRGICPENTKEEA